MRGIIATVAGLVCVAAAGPALAQQAIKLSQHNAWAAYGYQAGKTKTCYILTVPVDKQPPTLNHGDMFFFVSQRPGQPATYEPQFLAGYNFQDGSKATVTIGDKAFSMYTKGNSAWVEPPAQEPALIAAMRAGSDMKVQAKSGRGNTTTYTFSLKGITAALDSIKSCK